MKTFDPQKRAAEKQAARDEDAMQLAAGEVTPTELRKRNGFFSALEFRNWVKAPIAVIIFKCRPLETSIRQPPSS